MSWFQTVSGRTIDLTKPPASWPFVISDIAHALSNTCRWGGHARFFYSVAQHSIIVANSLPTPELQFMGLMHDAAEAYVGDMIGPLKRLESLSGYKALENAVHDAIATRLGLPIGFQEIPEVRNADLRALATECEDLCFSSKEHENWLAKSLPEPFDDSIPAWSAAYSKTEFLKLYHRLWYELHPDVTPVIENELL
jgi:5'-deoxynucleotidase YfbR-like HD superfamily hydrolase